MKKIAHFIGMIGKGLWGLGFSILKLCFSLFRGSFRKMPILTSILIFALLGFFVGSFVGASMGVAFSGDAVNGAVVFGPIGAVIGFLFGPWMAGAFRAFRRNKEGSQ